MPIYLVVKIFIILGPAHEDIEMLTQHLVIFVSLRGQKCFGHTLDWSIIVFSRFDCCNDLANVQLYCNWLYLTANALKWHWI